MEDPSSRAASRGSWSVRRYRLGQEPSDDLSGVTKPEVRLGMMWPLALEAWSLAGRPLPDYPRHRAPVKCLRREVS